MIHIYNTEYLIIGHLSYNHVILQVLFSTIATIYNRRTTCKIGLSLCSSYCLLSYSCDIKSFTKIEIPTCMNHVRMLHNRIRAMINNHSVPHVSEDIP